MLTANDNILNDWNNNFYKLYAKKNSANMNLRNRMVDQNGNCVKWLSSDQQKGNCVTWLSSDHQKGNCVKW